MFGEKAKKPSASGLIPLSYKDNLLKELSKAVQENYTKNARILREYKEYIEYLEQELEKSRDLECQANNQVSYEYILKCEVETLLEEKQEQIVALQSQLDSQQPELPDFVAKDIEEFRKHIETVGLLYYEDFMSHETLYWIIDIRNHAAFMQALSTGEYKASKEKWFYLKNKLTGLYLCESKKGFFEQENPTLELTRRCEFSQQEIDNMDTGSYEQIEVEV